MARKGRYAVQARTRLKPNPALEKMVLVVAIVEPLMTLPQILQIYREHNTGVSMLTWSLYLGASLVWLIYGLMIRSKPIIVTDILWVVVETAVIVGVFTH